MPLVHIKPAELLNLVPYPTDFHVDLAGVRAKADMDNLIVAG